MPFEQARQAVHERKMNVARSQCGGSPNGRLVATSKSKRSVIKLIDSADYPALNASDCFATARSGYDGGVSGRDIILYRTAGRQSVVVVIVNGRVMLSIAILQEYCTLWHESLRSRFPARGG